jgi:hypothetical protein
VDQVRNNPQAVSFSRWLQDSMLADWQKILDDMRKFEINTADDTVFYKFGPLGRFTVKSVYNALTSPDSGPYHRRSGKVKFLLK